MSDKVYKKIRVVGCSASGYDEAVRLAIRQASESVHGISWWEVVEMRGAVADGEAVEWQVTMDVGFKVD